jgi:hypothetical protein
MPHLAHLPTLAIFANFLELRKSEVRRIHLLSTWVNKFYCISYAELSPCGELTRGADRAY